MSKLYDKDKLEGVIKSEKKCDKLKDEYIQILFQNKRALPFLVEDRYKIIKLVDQVLGSIEFFARFLKIYPFELYDDISKEFKEIIKNNGEETFLLKLILSDDTSSIRVLIWGMNAIESLKNLSDGDGVKLSDVIIKENSYTNEKELVFTKNSSLEIL